MTLDKVKRIISSQLNISESKINIDSKLIEDLGADSLDTVELLIAFEEEFGMRISDEEAMEIKTIKNIVDLIDSKIKK